MPISLRFLQMQSHHEPVVLQCNRKNKFRLEKHSLEVAPTTLLLTPTYSYQLRSAFQLPKISCFSKFTFTSPGKKGRRFPYDLEL